MKITVKTAGRLTRFLPAGTQGNSTKLAVKEGATPLDVIVQLGMPVEASYLVILNGETVPKSERAACRLAENDRLALMPPLKGG